MDKQVVETSGLTVFYGLHRGIIDLDLGVRQGEVYGFLGPNGAGKTTLRVLLDIIRPTAGRASVFGLDYQEEGCKSGSTWAICPASCSCRWPHRQGLSRRNRCYSSRCGRGLPRRAVRASQSGRGTPHPRILAGQQAEARSGGSADAPAGAVDSGRAYQWPGPADPADRAIDCARDAGGWAHRLLLLPHSLRGAGGV